MPGMTNLNAPRAATERKLDRADFDHYATLDATPDDAAAPQQLDANAVVGVLLMVTSAALVVALFCHLIAMTWGQS